MFFSFIWNVGPVYCTQRRALCMFFFHSLFWSLIHHWVEWWVPKIMSLLVYDLYRARTIQRQSLVSERTSYNISSQLFFLSSKFNAQWSRIRIYLFHSLSRIIFSFVHFISLELFIIHWGWVDLFGLAFLSLIYLWLVVWFLVHLFHRVLHIFHCVRPTPLLFFSVK